MHAPIKDFVCKSYPEGNITQWFGENPELYGAAWWKNQMDGHNGIDIVAPWRTPLMAVVTGTITHVKRAADGYGRHIRLLDDNFTTPTGTYQEMWVYAHCEDIFVEPGDRVEAGQVIGTMGNTGFVVSGDTAFWKYNPFKGTHLHLGVREVSMTSKTEYKVKNYNNGFFGSYDFRDRLERATVTVTKKAQQLTVISLANYIIKLLKR